MARAHGRISSAIWNDREFLALPVGPQRLYMFLVSQPDLSHAGLIPLRLRRWAQKAVGYTDECLTADLASLEAERFVLLDIEAEELLVRTLVRNDGVYKQPKVMIRMREDARQITSPRLRAAFAAELGRLPLDELSDHRGGAKGDQPSTREQVQTVIDALREDFADTLGWVPDTPPEGYAEGSPIPPAYARAPSPSPRPRPLPPSPSPQPHLVAEVVSQSSLANARAEIGDHGIDDYTLDTIAARCRADRVWAEEVVQQVLAGRDDVRDPGKYVLSAVNANPDRYRPTPTPEPYRSSPNFGMPA